MNEGLLMNEFVNIDCMEYMKKLGGGTVDLTLTDIPYDGVNNAKESGLRKLKKGNADIITFDLPNFLEEVYRITKGTIIIFCGEGQVSDILKHFRYKQDFENEKISVRQLIWEKTNPSPMNGQFHYLSAIENAVYVKKSGATYNAFCKSNVLRHPTGSSEIHPTEKNHQLLMELIRDCTNEGDVVFDACAGSGSTLLVAHRMGRQYLGCELNEDFYNKASKRLTEATSQMNIYDYLGYNPYQE